MRPPLPLIAVLIAAAMGCSGGSSSSRVATIWSNGSVGCWGDTGDDCGSGGNRGKMVGFQGGGVGAGNVALADSVTGGLPSLQLTSSNASGTFGYCIGGGSLNQCTQRDLSSFKSGHLQFDIRLESPTVTAVSLTLFNSLTVQIPVASLNQTSFVHQSIALTPALYGTNGPGVAVLNVFQIDVENSAPSSNQPVLTLNDIKWTSN